MTPKTKDEQMSDSVTINDETFEIVGREKAVTDETMTPIASMQGKELRSVDRILLADERELFQCVHAANPNCGYTANTIRSVTAHQRTHSGAAVAKQKQAEVDAANERAAAAEQALNERKQAASDRAKKAAATRESRKYDKNDEVAAPTTTTTNVNAASKEVTLLIQRVQLTANAVDDATEAHRKAVLNLVKFINDHPAVDPQIIAKAKQYDVLKAALNGAV